MSSWICHRLQRTLLWECHFMDNYYENVTSWNTIMRMSLHGLLFWDCQYYVIQKTRHSAVEFISMCCWVLYWCKCQWPLYKKSYRLMYKLIHHWLSSNDHIIMHALELISKELSDCILCIGVYVEHVFNLQWDNYCTYRWLKIELYIQHVFNLQWDNYCTYRWLKLELYVMWKVLLYYISRLTLKFYWFSHNYLLIMLNQYHVFCII